jgi:hypothetical protein
MESEVDRVNEKIRREAQMMMETRRMVGRSGDILDRLDEYSDRFKDTMKAKFVMNFVSSGEVTTVKKEASVTFVKKPDQQGHGNVAETVPLSLYKPAEDTVTQGDVLPTGYSRFSY